MGRQISPVFDALEDQARKYRKSYLVFEGARICQRAAEHRQEIKLVRQHRALMRKESAKVGKRNGAFVSGEIHPIEMEAIQLLCPGVNGKGKNVTKAWQWVFKQDWGKEFLNAPYEKTRF